MILGLDLSGAVARATAVTHAGEVVARAEHDAGKDLASAARESLNGALTLGGKQPEGVGIATVSPLQAEPADIAAAVADLAPGAPLVFVTAGTASALAEAWCGAARGLTTIVSFTIGEHVLAGLIVGGHAWTGAHGYAGSVGWLALNPVEREDYRRLGALEAEVAAAGIVRRLIWRVKSGDESTIVHQVGGDLSRLTADMVFTGARQGDGVCISVVRDTAKYVGMAVSNLAAVLDPEAVVLGGTLARLGDTMLDAVRTECSRRLSPLQAGRVRILLSTLGADAVAIGAARAAALRAT